MPELVVAGIIQAALFFVTVVEREWVWIERAPDDFRRVGARRKIWKVYIVEKTGLDWFRQEFGEDRSDPGRCAGPIVIHALLAIVRYGDPGPAMQHGFTHRGHGAGVVHGGAEIRAVSDV